MPVSRRPSPPVAVLRRWSLAAALAALAALAAGPSGAQSISDPYHVVVSPAAPTWRDQVELVVTGTIREGDGVGIISPPAVVLLTPGYFRIDVVLGYGGILPTPAYVPFELRVPLAPLEPGSYATRITAEGGGEAAVADPISFEVHAVSTAWIRTPALSTDVAPGQLEIGISGGGTAQPGQIQVDGQVIAVPVSFVGVPTFQLSTLHVPLPALAPGFYEIHVLPTAGGVTELARGSLRVWHAGGCLPDGETLCLRDGRFRVRATWDDGSRTGVAGAAPLDGNDGSGLLWFFAADNAELTIKVIDACSYNGHWWVFVASGSNVRYTVTVDDTARGLQRVYQNPQGVLPPLIADVTAFSCAP